MNIPVRYERSETAYVSIYGPLIYQDGSIKYCWHIAAF